MALETLLQGPRRKYGGTHWNHDLLFGTTLLAVAECMCIQPGVSEDPLIVAYVVQALLGQVNIGVALLQAKLSLAWIGWTAIKWKKLGMLIILVGFDVGGHHIPLVHHVMPLLIGIPLLWRG